MCLSSNWTAKELLLATWRESRSLFCSQGFQALETQELLRRSVWLDMCELSGSVLHVASFVQIHNQSVYSSPLAPC